MPFGVLGPDGEAASFAVPLRSHSLDVDSETAQWGSSFLPSPFSSGFCLFLYSCGVIWTALRKLFRLHISSDL